MNGDLSNIVLDGLLKRRGIPFSVEEVSRDSGADKREIEAALDRLQNLGWEIGELGDNASILLREQEDIPGFDIAMDDALLVSRFQPLTHTQRDFKRFDRLQFVIKFGLQVFLQSAPVSVLCNKVAIQTPGVTVVEGQHRPMTELSQHNDFPLESPASLFIS